MKICYIKEEKNAKWYNKKIKIKEENGVYICKIPINKNSVGENCVRPKNKKIVNKKLIDNKISTVVLSEYLESINEIELNRIKILDGRTLFSYLIYDVIEYIAVKQGKKIEEFEVSILANNSNSIEINSIIMIAKQVKNLNIVTNNIQKFKKVEEYLYSELGILIKVSNNKNKAILKSNIIINTDFEEELTNKYTIPNKGIIINANKNINIKSKKFNGLNINGYKIEIPEEYKLEGFRNETIYESYVYNQNFEKIRGKIIEDNIRIAELIGNNGAIDKNEFLKVK